MGEMDFVEVETFQRKTSLQNLVKKFEEPQLEDLQNEEEQFLNSFVHEL